jgi:hypothetical protein
MTSAMSKGFFTKAFSGIYCVEFWAGVKVIHFLLIYYSRAQLLSHQYRGSKLSECAITFHLMI